MRHGRRVREPMLHLVTYPNQLSHSRIGYAVSRRVGGAVTRNRLKRRLRAIIREMSIRPGYDIVAIPQHSFVKTSKNELSRVINSCLERTPLLSSINEDEN